MRDRAAPGRGWRSQPRAPSQPRPAVLRYISPHNFSAQRGACDSKGLHNRRIAHRYDQFVHAHTHPTIILGRRRVKTVFAAPEAAAPSDPRTPPLATRDSQPFWAIASFFNYVVFRIPSGRAAAAKEGKKCTRRWLLQRLHR